MKHKLYISPEVLAEISIFNMNFRNFNKHINNLKNTIKSIDGLKDSIIKLNENIEYIIKQKERGN